MARGREGREAGGRGLPEKPYAALGLSGTAPRSGGGLRGGDLMDDLGRTCGGQVRLWGRWDPGGVAQCQTQLKRLSSSSSSSNHI